MTCNIKIVFLTLHILVIMGCQNSDKKDIDPVHKEFGNWDSGNDSLGVELEVSQFKTWNDLVERTETIVCNDSLPKITLKTDKDLNTIYFRNLCSENFGCILIRERNMIEIHNDTINTSDGKFYPLDSLDNVIKRDFENNGKNPMFSDSPEKLLFFVSYDNIEPEKLLKTLNELTQAYERTTKKTDIKIWLYENFYIPPPPPISAEIGEIEIEEEEL